MRTGEHWGSSDSAIEMYSLGDEEEGSFPERPGSTEEPVRRVGGSAGIAMSQPIDGQSFCCACNQDCQSCCACNQDCNYNDRCVGSTMMALGFVTAMSIVIYCYVADILGGSESLQGSRWIAGICFALVATTIFFVYMLWVDCGSSQRELGVRRPSSGSNDGSGDYITQL